MFRKVMSGGICGIEGCLVEIEADISNGLPCLEMVGTLAPEVREAKERVRTALKNLGFRLPPKRITINLSPADVRKEGTGYDLPIAVAILAAMEYIPAACLEGIMLTGELGLDGSIRPVKGILPLADCAGRSGLQWLIVPEQNAGEGATIGGVRTAGAENLLQVLEWLNHPDRLRPAKSAADTVCFGKEPDTVDFSEIRGQQMMRRGAEVAAAGMHNLLFIGPPGSGKTMIARRIPTILPRLTLEESIEITKIYSISGLLPSGEPLITRRPFRAPHHTVSAAALVGGGRYPKPGEISLASGGVLFLDELPEFSRNAVESLRQPMEDGTVTISRLGGSVRFPADIMLVAAMNPCSCGYFPDAVRCSCSEQSVNRYLNRISRPLLDRIDICIEAQRVPYDELRKKAEGETSEAIRLRVEEARKIQARRFGHQRIRFNSQISAKEIRKYCNLGEKEEKLMEQVFKTMNLSVRGYHRILRTARTIADLAGEREITTVHLSEALCYRGIEQKYWKKGVGE